MISGEKDWWTEEFFSKNENEEEESSGESESSEEKSEGEDSEDESDSEGSDPEEPTTSRKKRRGDLEEEGDPDQLGSVLNGEEDDVEEGMEED